MRIFFESMEAYPSAKQAMSLDGGASSALYGQGKVVTSAGRLLSNTLVFGGNLKRNP